MDHKLSFYQIEFHVTVEAKSSGFAKGDNWRRL
jgi:hypothetical protein